MAGVCEYDNEPLNHIKGGEFLAMINNNEVYKIISLP
jgi:hypothetical protein